MMLRVCQRLMLCSRYKKYVSRRCIQYEVPYTRVTHPAIKRGNYKPLSQSDITFFKGVCSESRVLTEDLDKYNIDWLNICRGESSLVVKPKTTEEISTILRYCNDNRLAVVPQGGNTGLVGGSVPVFDEIVISMELMNNIISTDDASGSVVCDAGCVLEQVNVHLSRYNLMMPLDLGAKGSCQIGGNVATNAGGIRVLRYGTIHANLLGLEVVLANGDVLDCMCTLRKDNTGYDIKRLFVGSEGTLGIITKAAILCHTLPRSEQVTFLGVETFSDILTIFKEAKSDLAEVLSAFEFMDNEAMKMVTEQLNLRNPITDNPFYVLVEISGSESEHNEEKLSQFLEKMLSNGHVTDGTTATDPSKIKNIWSVRERLSEAQKCRGYTYKYDISLPLQHIYDPVNIIRTKLGNKVQLCIGYGHLGDGNLHLNLTTDVFDANVIEMLEPFLFQLTSSYNGSISAEHGLGLKKNNFINYSKSPSAVKMMFRIKHMLDPNNILNPYKTLPLTERNKYY